MHVLLSTNRLEKQGKLFLSMSSIGTNNVPAQKPVLTPSSRSPRQEWENLAHLVTFCEDDSWPVSSTMWLLLW
jgi:hypothetical protein